MSELKESMQRMRQLIFEGQKHLIEKDRACVICGKTNVPLAFEMLDRSETGEEKVVPLKRLMLDDSHSVLYSGAVYGKDAYPDDSVPTELTVREPVYISNPVCISCAPACKKCELPIATEKVKEYSNKKDISLGSGRCQHMQIGILFSSIHKRVFKR